MNGNNEDPVVTNEIKYSKVFIPFLFTGYIVVLGLTIWPISNYATLYYLIFFFPFILFIVINCKIIIRLFNGTDKKLLLSTVALLAWVNLSIIWNDDKNLKDLLSSFKVTLMISLFILATATVVRFFPKIFPKIISTIILAVMILAAFSVIHHLEYIQNKPITTRILQLGYSPLLEVVNAATTGIYLGAIAIFSIIVFFSYHKNNLVVARALQVPQIAIIFVFVIICWTRSVFLGLYFTFLIYTIYEKKTYLLLAAAVLPILSIPLILTIGAPQIESIVTRGGNWRIQIWTTYIEAGLKDFWLGKGFLHNSNLDVTGIINGNLSVVTHPHSHNFYIQIFYWLGVIGLSLYVFVLYRILKISFASREKFEAQIAIGVICYFLVVQIFDVYNIFTKPSYYWPCIWLPIGICLGIDRKKIGNSQAND